MGQSIIIYRKLLAVVKSNYAPCFAHNEQVDSFQTRNEDFRKAVSDCLRKDSDWEQSIRRKTVVLFRVVFYTRAVQKNISNIL